MPRSLPARPDLEHLKNQAKDLLKRGGAPKLSDAQHAVAREYGFPHWTALKQHVELVRHTAEPFELLGRAVRRGDLAEARSVLGGNPALRGRLDQAVPGGDFGATALLTAVHLESREMAQLLLDAGADINARSDWWAGGFGVLDHEGPLVDWLIERGARMDAYAAARHGRMDRLDALVKADPAQVGCRGGDGQTPLHVAKTVAIAGYLLEHGADIDALDIDHESTPAQYLVTDRPDVARYLVSRGAKSDILLASALGDLSLVKRHLAANPAAIRLSVSLESFPKMDPRAGGTIYIWTLGWNKTPHTAARDAGHGEILEYLWQHSPDDLQLSVAIEVGDAPRVQRLLAGRPDLPAHLSEADRKRLVAAAVDENLAAVRMMLAAGWPVNTIGHEGATALHWASFHGNLDMVREILAHRPDLHRKDTTHGGTALSWATYGSVHGWRCKTGDYAGTVTALIAAGATIPDPAAGSEAVMQVLRREDPLAPG